MLIFGACAPLNESRIDTGAAATPEETDAVELLSTTEILLRLREVVFPIHRQVITRNILALIG